MSSSVIKIENLYKEYRLGTIGYGTLREDLGSWWAKIMSRPDPNSILGQSNEKPIGSTDHILALNNINLEVKQGERLGIIGKNGAGKTTLLKILSRITSPTKGLVRIKGRVASLIAVGTGFHSELTGKENIYLNGTILGLNKREIDKRFDEIVDFSGVEPFIDTPVKRYSTGMYIRLGFAVAAHLDPDVLIVDEVLAVGDAEFQRKALGKMKDASDEEGRTILFVSHNMKAITNLCSSAILIEEGNIIKLDNPQKVVNDYLTRINTRKASNGEVILKDIEQEGNFTAKIERIQLINNDEVKGIFDIKDDITVKADFINYKDGNKLCFYIHVIDKNENIVFASANLPSITKGKDPWFDMSYPKGKYITHCNLPSGLLNTGNYILNFQIQYNITQHVAISGPVLEFRIIDELGSIKELNQEWPGMIRPKLEWITDKV